MEKKNEMPKRQSRFIMKFKKPDVDTCQNCGKPIPYIEQSPFRKYCKPCSPKVRERQQLKYMQQRKASLTSQEPRYCKLCDKVITKSKFCSPKCREDFHIIEYKMKAVRRAEKLLLKERNDIAEIRLSHNI
jgi:predicted nucleic acid-binding Zn ribbon protein